MEPDACNAEMTLRGLDRDLFRLTLFGQLEIGRQQFCCLPPHRERRTIDMLWIIALVLIAILVLAVISFALHLLFSPWLLLAAIGILAWLKFRPRRSPR